jgi:hypothetical protein
VLSQVQDDRIWKDIKCFVEIYEKIFNRVRKAAVYRLFHQPIMGRLAGGGKNSCREPKQKQRGGKPRSS